MTEVIIGTVGDAGSADALALGIAISRTLRAAPLIAHVRPEPWLVPGSGRVDAEWDAYLDRAADQTVAATMALRPLELDQLGAETVVHRHRHSGRGLDQLAVDRDAALIVIGSAPGGLHHRIQGGSTSEQLLHGASVPVAIAPAGYSWHAPERIERVVVAVEPETSRELFTGVVAAASRYGVELALITVVRRATSVYSTQLGPDAETGVIAALRDEGDRALQQAQEWAGRDLDGAVVVGDTVAAALATYDWRPGDILGVGSSRLGPIRRILMGDMTFRIVRGATVPVLIAPRYS